jgi:hypothetical protein
MLIFVDVCFSEAKETKHKKTLVLKTESKIKSVNVNRPYIIQHISPLNWLPSTLQQQNARKKTLQDTLHEIKN